MKLCYACHYDGKKCDKAIPRFTDEAELIPESNEKIKEKYHNIINEMDLDNSWDLCDNCSRNNCISGVCFGRLVVENGHFIDKL